MAPVGYGSSQPPIGLDIGTDFVRAGQIKSSGSGFVLTGYGRSPMPFGAVVEGEIVDPEAVGSSLKTLWKAAGFRSKEVSVGVANQKVVVRLIDLPFMQKAELDGAIQYQAQDYIPIPLDQAILAYEIIGDYMTPADEHMMEVLLVAAQRDMIDNVVRAVEVAGLKLMTIDVTSFALVRSLLGPTSDTSFESDQGAVALVHVSSGFTNIAVVEKGVPRFTRVSSVAGNEFTQAVATALSLTYDEAEALKIQVGLPSLDGTQYMVPGVAADKAQAAQQALEREAGKFIAEIRRSLDYYLTQATQVRTINRIVMSGSASMLRGLPAYVQQGLQTQVVMGDPLAFVQVSKALTDVAEADRMGCAPAIGLALGGVI